MLQLRRRQCVCWMEMRRRSVLRRRKLAIGRCSLLLLGGEMLHGLRLLRHRSSLLQPIIAAAASVAEVIVRGGGVLLRRLMLLFLRREVRWRSSGSGRCGGSGLRRQPIVRRRKVICGASGGRIV